MSTLQHAIKIHAPRPRVYQALTDTAQVARWHMGEVEGAIAAGAVLTLVPRPGLAFSWRTDSLETDQRIVQTSLQNCGAANGKRLVFELQDAGDDYTTLRLSDGEWRADDPHLAFCNTHWGDALNRLKDFVEQP